MNEINVLFTQLSSKAERTLKNNLQLLGSNFIKHLGYCGKSEEFTITKGDKSVTLSIYSIIDQLTSQCFEKQKEGFIDKEIEQFLNSVSDFSAKLKALEQAYEEQQ